MSDIAMFVVGGLLGAALVYAIIDIWFSQR